MMTMNSDHKADELTVKELIKNKKRGERDKIEKKTRKKENKNPDKRV